MDPEEDEEEIEERAEGPSDEKPHPLPAHHVLKVIRAMVSLEFHKRPKYTASCCIILCAPKIPVFEVYY